MAVNNYSLSNNDKDVLFQKNSGLKYMPTYAQQYQKRQELFNQGITSDGNRIVKPTTISDPNAVEARNGAMLVPETQSIVRKPQGTTLGMNGLPEGTSELDMLIQRWKRGEKLTQREIDWLRYYKPELFAEA